MPRKSNSVLGPIRLQTEAIRSNVLTDYPPHAIHLMDPTSIVALQRALEQANAEGDWGIWATPTRFIPGASDSLTRVNVRDRIIKSLPKHYRELAEQDAASQPFLRRMLDDALINAMRYLVLLCCGPVSLVNQKDALDRSVVANLARSYIPKLAAMSIASALDDGHAQDGQDQIACFGRIKFEDVAKLSPSTSQQRVFRAELLRMRLLASRGLWADSPGHRDGRIPTSLTGDALEASPQKEVDTHLPLPDVYVGVLGQRSYWLTTHLFPNLERILIGFQDLWRDARNAKQLSGACASFLSSFLWKDGDGRPISAVPFKLRLSTHGQRSSSENDDELGTAVGLPQSEDDDSTALSTWPPTHTSQIFGLARAVQAAHYFISALSMGARSSESLTLPRYCIEEMSDGTPMANGKTYKLVLRHDGEERSWGLPQLAVQALQQQAKLVALLEKLSSSSDLRSPDAMPEGTHLWAQVGGTKGNRSRAITGDSLNALLRSLAYMLCMDSKPGGQNIRSHRLRKTLARLAALALADSPKILQHCFGHQSVEMTLYYILTDKALAAEIDTVLDELRIARAEVAVRDMVEAIEQARLEGRSPADGYGGRGAIALRKIIAEKDLELIERGNTWQLTDIRATAEVLTIGGKVWNLVREGVICSKAPAQYGPCNRRRGKPDPTNCQSSCDHRIEETTHLHQVDGRIAYALRCYRSEIDAGRDLAAEAWAGQIRNDVNRFDALREKWLADPTIAFIHTAQDASTA